MRRILRGVSAVALMLVASCDTLTGIQPDRALWQALDIQNYDFVYQRLCFCGPLGPNPAKLSVRGGVVVKVEPVDNSTVYGVTPPAASYPTIDSLFAKLEAAQKTSPDGVSAEFDPTYHYPTKISIDPIKNAVDDEVTYIIQKFTPVIVTGSN